MEEEDIYDLNLNLQHNNLLIHAEEDDSVRMAFLKVLFGVVDRVTFKNVINQNAWSLCIVKILARGLPALSLAIMDCLVKYIKAAHLSLNHIR